MEQPKKLAGRKESAQDADFTIEPANNNHENSEASAKATEKEIEEQKRILEELHSKNPKDTEKIKEIRKWLMDHGQDPKKLSSKTQDLEKKGGDKKPHEDHGHEEEKKKGLFARIYDSTKFVPISAGAGVFAGLTWYLGIVWGEVVGGWKGGGGKKSGGGGHGGGHGGGGHH